MREIYEQVKVFEKWKWKNLKSDKSQTDRVTLTKTDIWTDISQTEAVEVDQKTRTTTFQIGSLPAANVTKDDKTDKWTDAEDDKFLVANRLTDT